MIKSNKASLDKKIKESNTKVIIHNAIETIVFIYWMGKMFFGVCIDYNKAYGNVPNKESNKEVIISYGLLNVWFCIQNSWVQFKIV